MRNLATNTAPLGQRLTRTGLLILLAAAIVGIGCATIRVPAPKDETAETVYLPAARNGDAARQLQLALAYRYGSAGVARNNGEAVAWLGKAAAGGNVQAQLMLGDAYLNGELGLEQQPETGLAWLRKAAGSGSPDAQFYLARVLEDGRAAPEAAALYEKAARNDRKFAAWRLARMLERGAGIDANLVEAYAWYRISDSSADAERLRLRMKVAEVKAAEQRFSVLTKEIAK